MKVKVEYESDVWTCLMSVVSNQSYRLLHLMCRNLPPFPATNGTNANGWSLKATQSIDLAIKGGINMNSPGD